MSEKVKDHVLAIIHQIENGVDCDGNEIESAFDYLEDMLDIQYSLNSDKTLRGARILVAFGGPNLWINTENQTVEGYWWSDNCTMSYHTDELGLDDFVETLYNC